MAESKSESTKTESKSSSSSGGGKQGDLVGPAVFRDPETGEELKTETVETYEQGAESGFVGTKPVDEAK